MFAMTRGPRQSAPYATAHIRRQRHTSWPPTVIAHRRTLWSRASYLTRSNTSRDTIHVTPGPTISSRFTVALGLWRWQRRDPDVAKGARVAIHSGGGTSSIGLLRRWLPPTFLLPWVRSPRPEAPPQNSRKAKVRPRIRHSPQQSRQLTNAERIKKRCGSLIWPQWEGKRANVAIKN